MRFTSRKIIWRKFSNSDSDFRGENRQSKVRLHSTAPVFLITVALFVTLLVCNTKEMYAKSKMQQQSHNPSVVIPENVAAVFRPLLDLRQKSISQCGAPGAPSRCIDGEAYTREHDREENFNRLLDRLVAQEGPDIDESLVVLMCFYVGESGEEIESVISRGRRMLPYLQKYQNKTPVVPRRVYTDSMSTDPAIKQEHFRAAMFSIK